MRTLPLTIKATCIAGGTIREGCMDLVEMARRLGCTVKCEMNGINVYAYPDDDPIRLFQAWEQSHDRGVKIAMENMLGRGLPRKPEVTP